MTLYKFLVEIKKKNGDFYPKETLYEIVLALLVHFEINGHSIKFLENDKFKAVHNTLDNHMKQLSKMGAVYPKEQAEPIEVSEEKI